MGWVFHNKLLYSGANALEQFCNSLLLHLQSYGSSPVTTTTTATGILYNQVSPSLWIIAGWMNNLNDG